jgi:transcriptional regulator with XRE-family HTH domain
MVNKKIAGSEEIFAERIRLLRNRAKLKQKEMALRLAIAPPYLSELESGKKTNPSPEVIQRICSEFSVTPSWLLGEGDTATKEQVMAAISKHDWAVAFSVLCEMKDEKSLRSRADDVLADAKRPLSDRIAFGQAVSEELERRKNSSQSQQQ